MKHSIKTLVATIALSAVITGSAMAMGTERSVNGVIQSALGSAGQVQVTVRDGVATLVGYVEDTHTESKVKRAALSHPEVDRVIDLITPG